jgi:hypothetical protein
MPLLLLLYPVRFVRDDAASNRIRAGQTSSGVREAPQRAAASRLLCGG